MNGKWRRDWGKTARGLWVGAAGGSLGGLAVTLHRPYQVDQFTELPGGLLQSLLLLEAGLQSSGEAGDAVKAVRSAGTFKDERSLEAAGDCLPGGGL